MGGEVQVAWQYESRLEIEDLWDGKGSPPVCVCVHKFVLQQSYIL